MKRAITWIWNRGIVSTFLAGFFVILPIAITVGIMAWVGGKLQEWVGPGSPVGKVLRSAGLRLVTNETVASVVGWFLVLAGLWLLGALVKSAAKYKLEEVFQATVGRIPVINSIYRPVSQVVAMLKQDDKSEMKGMRVVYCEFGQEHGGGFLGLRASENAYRFGEQDCYAVYVPTSPIPMSGGIVFVPVRAVRKVEMEVEDMMQIYFSLGIMSSKVVPSRYITSATGV